MAKSSSDSPNHPVIDRPFEFDIVRFDYHSDPDDYRNSYLDISLRRRTELRRLRFPRPQGLKIDEGFPNSTHGMLILDIRHRQWDDIGVEVVDFEASPGSVTFYAAEVIDLDIS